MTRKKLPTRDLCFIAIFTAIIAVLAQVSIPLPFGVPFTLQTFAIALAGVTLGAKRGTISTAIYVLLGAIGVPVFANFTGGFGQFATPTGGFLISFPLIALAVGIGLEKAKVPGLIIGLIVGIGLNYLCGMIVFTFVTSTNMLAAFTACVLPFLPTDILKAVLASVFGLKLRTILMKRKLLT